MAEQLKMKSETSPIPHPERYGTYPTVLPVSSASQYSAQAGGGMETAIELPTPDLFGTNPL